MQSSISTVSPLRQRMVEDMRMRTLAPKTQTAYIRAVRKFAKFLGHSPDTATDEDLRRFQLDMVDKGTSSITLNATIVALNFLFTVTLGRPEAMAKMQSVRVPRKLPVVLSKEEVTRLLNATPIPMIASQNMISLLQKSIEELQYSWRQRQVVSFQYPVKSFCAGTRHGQRVSIAADWHWVS